MSGYWRRVVASYTEGKHTFGLVPRFFDANQGALYDVSCMYAGSGGTLSLTPNLVHLSPFIVPQNSIFNDAYVNVTVSGGGANYLSLAIYRDTFDYVTPGPGATGELLELVTVLGNTAAGGFGLVNVGGLNLHLGQGYYFLAVQPSGAGTVISGWAQGTTVTSIFGFAAGGIATKRNGLIGDSDGSPATWKQRMQVFPYGVNALPRVFLQFQELSGGVP